MMWNGRTVAGVVVACALLAGGCAPASDEAPTEADVRQPYMALPPGPGGPVGVVLETLNGGGYTYARVQAEGEEIWTAGPGVDLAVDDTVYLGGASNMGYFKSPALDRVLDEIFFLDAYRIASAEDAVLRGTVLETMDVGGYTYVYVDVGEENLWMAPEGSEEPEVWLAGPETALQVGDVVSWEGGSVMREFYSRSLDRTFQEIVFVGSLAVANEG